MLGADPPPPSQCCSLSFVVDIANDRFSRYPTLIGKGGGRRREGGFFLTKFQQDACKLRSARAVHNSVFQHCGLTSFTNKLENRCRLCKKSD